MPVDFYSAGPVRSETPEPSVLPMAGASNGAGRASELLGLLVGWGFVFLGGACL